MGKAIPHPARNQSVAQEDKGIQAPEQCDPALQKGASVHVPDLQFAVPVLDREAPGLGAPGHDVGGARTIRQQQQGVAVERPYDHPTIAPPRSDPLARRTEGDPRDVGGAVLQRDAFSAVFEVQQLQHAVAQPKRQDP